MLGKGLALFLLGLGILLLNNNGVKGQTQCRCAGATNDMPETSTYVRTKVYTLSVTQTTEATTTIIITFNAAAQRKSTGYSLGGFIATVVVVSILLAYLIRSLLTPPS